MAKQYVQISFSSSPNAPLYTYINDEEDDVQVGDMVEFEGKYGTQIREVVGVSTQAPSLPSHVTLKHCYLQKGGSEE